MMFKLKPCGKSVNYFKPVCLILTSLFSLAVSAESKLIDGEHGVIHVSGALTEGACHLKMESADQSIDLGNTGVSRLQRPGEQGRPVVITLYLQDCIRSAENTISSQGNITWSANQPAVSVTFTGDQDSSNPQLFRARGVTGVGLRLIDSSHRVMTPGLTGHPQLLTPENNILTYYIMPERTKERLRVGSYLADVNFRLSYE